MIALWLIAAALGAETWPVRPGDTVESIAAAVAGTVDAKPVALAIRTQNALAANAQPPVGTLLVLPDAQGLHVDQKAFVLTKRGTVTVSGLTPRRNVALYERLPMGSVVCTGAESFASIRVSTQCTVDGANSDDLTLSPETCVELVSAHGSDRGRSTVARVLSGSIQVQKNDKGTGHVTVQAGTGQTTGAEGGYRVTLEEQAMRAEALYAEVAVQGAGAQVDLSAGQGSRVKDGEAPSPAVDLVPPGQPKSPDANTALRRPWFTWAPMAEAFGYRFEVAATPDFVDLVFSDDVPDPEYRPSLLLLPWPNDGVLHWRISSFDRFGFLGIPSEPRAMRLPTG
jgi:hypothetical protein